MTEKDECRICMCSENTQKDVSCRDEQKILRLPLCGLKGGVWTKGEIELRTTQLTGFRQPLLVFATQNGYLALYFDVKSPLQESSNFT